MNLGRAIALLLMSTREKLWAKTARYYEPVEPSLTEQLERSSSDFDLRTMFDFF